MQIPRKEALLGKKREDWKKLQMSGQIQGVVIRKMEKRISQIRMLYRALISIMNVVG